MKYVLVDSSSDNENETSMFRIKSPTALSASPSKCDLPEEILFIKKSSISTFDFKDNPKTPHINNCLVICKSEQYECS